MTRHSSILVWKISRTERSGRLQSMESQRVGHNWAQQSSSRRLGLSHEILALRKPLHPGKPGWLITLYRPPNLPFLSVALDYLRTPNLNTGLLSKLIQTLRSFSLLCLKMLFPLPASSHCPGTAQTPLISPSWTARSPSLFPSVPFLIQPLFHQQTSGNEVTEWKVCHSVTQFSDSAWHSAPHHTSLFF